MRLAGSCFNIEANEATAVLASSFAICRLTATTAGLVACNNLPIWRAKVASEVTVLAINVLMSCFVSAAKDATTAAVSVTSLVLVNVRRAVEPLVGLRNLALCLSDVAIELTAVADTVRAACFRIAGNEPTAVAERNFASCFRKLAADTEAVAVSVTGLVTGPADIIVGK